MVEFYQFYKAIQERKMEQYELFYNIIALGVATGVTGKTVDIFGKSKKQVPNKVASKEEKEKQLQELQSIFE